MPKNQKWYIGYTLWTPGDRLSRTPGNVYDLSSLKECKQEFSRIPVNRRMGYEFLSANAHGPAGEVINLLK